jgi:hypothetical protein
MQMKLSRGREYVSLVYETVVERCGWEPAFRGSAFVQFPWLCRDRPRRALPGVPIKLGLFLYILTFQPGRPIVS